MSIVWSDVEPGFAEPIVQELGDAVLLLGDGYDHIRVPEDLGGTSHRIIGRGRGRCVCDLTHEVRHWQLDNGIYVAECSGQFLWYRRSGDSRATP